MAVIKCKMCGGDVQVTEGKTLGTCTYCGNSITFESMFFPELPRQFRVSEKTLCMMDNSIENLNNGNVSEGVIFSEV